MLTLQILDLISIWFSNKSCNSCAYFHDIENVRYQCLCDAMNKLNINHYNNNCNNCYKYVYKDQYA